MSRWCVGALVLGLLVTFGVAVVAAEIEEVEEFDSQASSPVNQQRVPPRADSWYYHPTTETNTYNPNPRQIIQHRAMARAQQRSDRLASLSWYGMYNARPTAAPIPYCTPLYSPAWQSPYGAGFSWRQGQPTYIITGSRPTYVVR